MAKKRKIGAIIALDGEKEFRSAVTSCNKALATMKSEMKLVAAETSGNANSLTALKSKHDVLQKTLDKQLEKEETLQKGLDHSKEDYEKVGKVLTEYKTKLSTAQKELEEMEASQDSSSEAIIQQKETVEQLAAEVDSVETVYNRAGNRVGEWEKSLNNAKAETIKATQALKENDRYMAEAEQSTDHCATSIDEFGKKAQAAQEDLTSFGNVVKVNLVNTLVDAGKTLAKSTFESAVQGALDLQTATNQLAASTGASAEETKKYSSVMETLYRNNYGESMDELASAIEMIAQYTGETDPEKIEDLTENALALSDTFDIDMREGIRAVNTLMNQMGLTSEEAFDLIAKGAQNGLNQSDELADNLIEYTSLWSQAGFSAEEMFTILENGLDSGAYNLDKVNDFVKEFGNSLADGRIEDNLSSFSSETQTLFYQWKNGQATTKQVFTSVINDLDSMTNKQEALTIASDTWSSLGEDNAMAVITSLNDVNDAYTDVEGTMEDIKNIKYDSLANQWQKIGRTFQSEVAIPIAEDFLPIAEKGINLLADNTEKIIPIVAGVGAAFGAEKIISGITGITTAMTASATATEGASAAMTILNTVTSANPAVLIAAGIGVATAAVVAFSGSTEEAVTESQRLADAAATVNESAGNAATALNEATAGISSAMDGSSASASTAYSLVDELEELSQKSSLTATEQSRMKTVVGELNTMFPEMSLAIDDTTGALSLSKEEIRQYINTAVDMAKIEAVQKAVKESTEKMVDAEIERTKAEEQLKETTDALSDIQKKRVEADNAVEEKQKAIAEAQDAYNEAVSAGKDDLTEYTDIIQDTSEAQIEYNGQLMSVSAAMQQMQEDEVLLTETQQEQQEVLDGLTSSIDSAQAEIDEYTSYTDSLSESLNTNTESTNANAEAQAAQQEAASASISVAGEQLTAFNNLSEAQQQMAVDVTNSVLSMQDSVKSSLESQMNMFEEFNGGTEVTTQTLLDNMQSQVDGVTQWEQNIAALADTAISQDLLQSLIDMGPEGASYVQAFVDMSDEELAKANDLWGQSIDIKNMSNEWGNELTQAVGELAAGSEEAWNDLAQSMNQSASDSGGYVVQGLVNGMQEAQSQATEEGKDLGVKTIESVNDGAGVASPSTKTKQSGKYIVQGLQQGIKSNSSTAKTAAKTLGDDVVTSIKTALTSGQSTVYNAGHSLGNSAVRGASGSVSSSSLYNIGLNLAYGMANGISAGRSAVINSVANMCASAVSQARRSLDIHSPSRVFENIGALTIAGFPVGFESGTDDVIRSVEDSMDSISSAAIGAVDWGNGYNLAVGSSGSTPADGGNLNLQLPIYLNGVLTETQVEKISLNALTKSQRRISSAKGVRVGLA